MTVDEFGFPVLVGEEEQAARFVKASIDSVLDAIYNNETSLASNYINLGLLLTEVKSNKYWMAWDYESFGDYMDSVKEKIKKGRTQLYHILSVTEKLLPLVDEKTLQKIGITKAIELNKCVKATGKLPETLLEMATSDKVGVDELKAATFKVINPNGEEYKGTYYDFGGVYLEPEELAEVKHAQELACRIDPIISKDLPDFARRKEILLRLSREFIAEYENGEV